MEIKEIKNDISEQWTKLFDIIIKEDFLPKEVNTTDFFVKIYKKMEPIFVTYKFGDNQWMKYHYIVQEIIKVLDNNYDIWLTTEFKNLPKCVIGEDSWLINGSMPKDLGSRTMFPTNQYNANSMFIDIENVKKTNKEIIANKLWKMYVKQYDPYGLVYKTYKIPTEGRRSNHNINTTCGNSICKFCM